VHDQEHLIYKYWNTENGRCQTFVFCEDRGYSVIINPAFLVIIIKTSTWQSPLQSYLCSMNSYLQKHMYNVEDYSYHNR
jgi:hypothetical protein